MTPSELLACPLHRYLVYKLHVFVYDLHNFNTKPNSQSRLDEIVDTSYIGAPYFTDDEAQILKDLVIPPKTLSSQEEKWAAQAKISSNKTTAAGVHDKDEISSSSINDEPARAATAVKTDFNTATDAFQTPSQEPQSPEQQQPQSQTLHDLIQTTLQERLNRRAKKRIESEDYRVCAAHDVAPILEREFGIKGKDLLKNKGFLELVDMYGVLLDEAGEAMWEECWGDMYGNAKVGKMVKNGDKKKGRR